MLSPFTFLVGKLLYPSNKLNYSNRSHFRNSLHLEMLSMKQGLVVSRFPPAPFVIVPINDLSCTDLNLLYCVLSCVPFRNSWRFKINGTPGETMEELHRGWTCMGQAHNLSLCFFPASRSSSFLRSASNTCWHQVSESLGLNVPISQGHKFLRSQGLIVSRSQDLRVFKVPGFQGRKTSRSQAFKITLNVLRSMRFPKIY